MNEPITSSDIQSILDMLAKSCQHAKLHAVSHNHVIVGLSSELEGLIKHGLRIDNDAQLMSIKGIRNIVISDEINTFVLIYEDEYNNIIVSNEIESRIV